MNDKFRNLHTHVRPVDAPLGSYLLNVYPRDFAPVDGEWYSVGIHPWHAAEVDESDWKALETASRHPQVWALGECGLDKRCAVPLAVQQAVFRRQILLSESLAKPLVIHCVKSAGEVLQLRRQLQARQLWIIHGFRGKPTVARLFLQAGCALSFGPRFQAETVRLVPPSRLYAETDESDVPIEEVWRRLRDAIRNS